MKFLEDLKITNPADERVASGSYDKTVRVWDVQTGQCQHTLEGHSDRVTSVVFSPDGSRVASGSNEKTVRVWDVQTHTCPVAPTRARLSLP